MREIKFRAWDTIDKKYLYCEKQEFICTTHSNGLGVTIPYNYREEENDFDDEECFDWADADLLMGRYELEEYTGLKDENGKELYEEDVITCYPDAPVMCEGKVEFHYGTFGVRLYINDQFVPFRRINSIGQIIGNAHTYKWRRKNGAM